MDTRKSTPATSHRTTQLADLAHLVMSVSRDIRGLGLSDPEIIEVTHLESLVMGYLQRHPGAAPSRISAQVGLRSSNASAVLRSLEKKGMVRREPDPTDRRSVCVHPTALAATNLERVRAEWAQLLAPHVPVELDLFPVIELLSTVDDSLTGYAESDNGVDAGPARASR